MQLLLQNERWVAVDKPALWLTTPARTAEDPRPCLGRKLEAELGVRLFPVHRLDFEVSGIVLFAKDADAHRVMQSWFEHGSIQKTYEAWSAGGRPVGEWQEWHSKLVRGKRRTFEATHGKESLTRARVVESNSDHARWELMPLTGRPHQLRFEMSKHGSPILGDKLYGGPPWRADESIALRAVKLDLSAIEERLGLPEILTVEGI